MRCVFSLHSRSLARVSRLSSVFCTCVNKTTKEFEGGRVSPQSYIDKYGKDAEQLLIDLHSLFKYSAARRQDYKNLQLNLDLELKLFIEHSSLRWLSIGPAVRRILEQWQAKEQFVKFLESDPKRIPQSAAFRRVQAAIERNEILVQLNFIASTVALFETLMLNFQNDEPKIHVLYEQMVDLVKTFLL